MSRCHTCSEWRYLMVTSSCHISDLTSSPARAGRRAGGRQAGRGAGRQGGQAGRGAGRQGADHITMCAGAQRCVQGLPHSLPPSHHSGLCLTPHPAGWAQCVRQTPWRPSTRAPTHPLTRHLAAQVEEVPPICQLHGDVNIHAQVDQLAAPHAALRSGVWGGGGAAAQ
jgi:hypothetical protein